jgi:hypothetical protein
MKYLLTFVTDESAMEDLAPDEMQAGIEAWSAFDAEAAEAGVLIACEPLENSSTATTIRLQDDGEKIVSDGPYAETKEQLGGFALLECTSADEALEWAQKVPMRSGSIEIRQVMDLSRYGYESRTPAPVSA